MCFAPDPSVHVFVGSLWEKGVSGVPRYSSDLNYTEEAREWLIALLDAEGMSPIALEVAADNLIEDIVRRLHELPVPASTQDPAGWA